MNIGDSILCPVFSITHVMPPILDNRGNVFEIVRIKGKNYLKTKITEENLGEPYWKILLKFKIYCTGLSVATVGHFWVEDVLVNEGLETIWENTKAIHLVKDREIDGSGPQELKAKDVYFSQDLTVWISMSYPTVLIHHSVGLFLLRSVSMENIYPEALLNFFKIVEIVTYKRTMKKPELKVILRDSKYLKIMALDEDGISDFYKIRGRDVAHDWDGTEHVSRKQVVECKNWAEELIVLDMIDRRSKINEYKHILR